MTDQPDNTFVLASGIDDLKRNYGTSMFHVSCALDTIFENVKVLPRDSASPTIQILANLKPNQMFNILKQSGRNKFFLKISFPTLAHTLNPRQDMFEVERYIYAYILKYYLAGNLPNVVKYIASFSCMMHEHTVSQEFAVSVNDILRRSNRRLPQLANFMILEQIKAQSLWDFMENTSIKINDQALLTTIIQLLYTLVAFSELGIRHNDLHAGNIWMQRTDIGYRYYFVTEDFYFKIRTQVTAKIYDFDRSSIGDPSSPGYNEALLSGIFCYNYGECPGANNKFDIFTLCFHLNQTSRLPGRENIAPLVNAIINDIILNKTLFQAHGCCVHNGLLCKSTTGPGYGTAPCSPGWVPPDSEILSPIQALQLPYFRKFLEKVPRDNTLNDPELKAILLDYDPARIHPNQNFKGLYCLPSLNRERIVENLRIKMRII